MFAKEGLEGVVAARTSICLIDGTRGRLAFRGYSIDQLAGAASFEEVAYLLWYGDLPTRKEFASFDRDLRSHRPLSEQLSEALASILVKAQPIDALRSAVSLLAIDEPNPDDNSESANIAKGLRIAAAIPTLVAAHYRQRNGIQRVDPDPELGHAANLLYMLNGKPPSSPDAHALDAAMVLQADHGLNASTFAARVAAGTLADLHSAITSAVSTLKGPLHGGASRQVMELIFEISSKSKVRETVERMLKAKRTIPGFGHRVYKVADPRAARLKKILAELVSAGADPTHFEIATELEEVVQKRKKLEPNLDLYLAPLYHVLGIPQELFAPLFGCSRIAGWVAHVIEQHLDNRLIRPLEEYIGPLSRRFVPMSERR